MTHRRLLPLLATSMLVSSPGARAESIILFGTRISFSPDRIVEQSPEQPSELGDSADAANTPRGDTDPRLPAQGGEALPATPGDAAGWRGYDDLEDALAALDDFLGIRGQLLEAPAEENLAHAAESGPDAAGPAFFTWLGEDEVEISTPGLSLRQIREAMEDIGPDLRSCVDDRDPVSGELDLEVSVNPDGGVLAISTLETRPTRSLWGNATRAPDLQTTSCVERVIAGQRFPPTGVDEVFSFQYTVSLEF